MHDQTQAWMIIKKKDWILRAQDTTEMWLEISKTRDSSAMDEMMIDGEC